MPLQDLVTPEKPIPLFVEKCVEFIEDTGRKPTEFQERHFFSLVAICGSLALGLLKKIFSLYVN